MEAKKIHEAAPLVLVLTPGLHPRLSKDVLTPALGPYRIHTSQVAGASLPQLAGEGGA